MARDVNNAWFIGLADGVAMTRPRVNALIGLALLGAADAAESTGECSYHHAAGGKGQREARGRRCTLS